MQSDAKSVSAYLNSLPSRRREALQAVRKVIVENLPEGLEEAMNWGMITYQVPLSRYPDTYNGKPLMYAALASQKNHMAVYLTPMYMSRESARAFEAEYKATGKRIDAGKSCVRFRRLEDLPLELIGKVIASYSVDRFIREAEDARAKRGA